MRTNANTSSNPNNFYDANQFISNYSSSQSIATSHAQNDSGMFELNFHDERYLPFEGLGVYSQWLLEMPQENFDFSTISDVIIKVNYIARDGGSALRTAAKAAYNSRLAKVASSGLMRLFSARHEFPSQWQNFLNPDDGVPNQSLKIQLRKEHFPFQLNFSSIKINKLGIFLKLRKDKVQDGVNLSFNLISPTATGTSPQLTKDDNDYMIDYMIHWESAVRPIAASSLTIDIEVPRSSIPTGLQTKNTSGQPILDSMAIEDLAVVCYYTGAPKDMVKYFGANS